MDKIKVYTDWISWFEEVREYSRHTASTTFIQVVINWAIFIGTYICHVPEINQQFLKSFQSFLTLAWFNNVSLWGMYHVELWAPSVAAWSIWSCSTWRWIKRSAFSSPLSQVYGISTLCQTLYVPHFIHWLKTFDKYNIFSDHIKNHKIYLIRN